MSKVGAYHHASCPRCGASPCHQKRPPRKPMLDLGVARLIEDLHPSDGVLCRHCGLVFRVTALDADNGFIVSEDEMECIPNYCPNCGAKVVEP